MNKRILFALVIFSLVGIPLQPADAALTVEYLVVAGGGGGASAGANGGAGGGGAGGYLNGTHVLTSPTYTITVGAGGAANTNGNDSVFDTVTALGGATPFGSGGSGYGGNHNQVGGAGTVGQGNNGGNGFDGGSGATRSGGGGGGKGTIGANAASAAGGNGGDGLASSINGTSITYAGGGGGGRASAAGTAGTGGSGGGGNGGLNGAGQAGTANTGGGGGGGGNGGAGGAGGSGIVILRYLTSSFTATGGTITTDGSYTVHTFTTSGIFEITNFTPFFEVNDLIVENIGDAFSLTGNVTINAGILVNVTSIIYSVNGTIITTNSTGQNTTSYPTTISFGPFYYQQITDSIYNHTVTVNTQSQHDTFSNDTSSLLTREYDPDYFTALDPAEGLVNYTFVGTNTINVNRDTGGSVFNIECSYLSHSQAFFNDLSSGTWDNKTNVIFYEGDTTGSAYIACFNDGELFVIGINQSYSNAIIPGLLIFDQLGGFFGAPSIILVILSILSLGTGRNYPIIMLIAAAITGILLELELLTLDPGLVVALIVMTGFGLFGIRKFY